MIILNNLQMHHTSQQLKDLGLQLTELEAVLISPNILFQKLYELPKSRWSSLDGRVVNVPISRNSRLTTIKDLKLPRTPLEGEIILVELKRMKEYKSNYKKQLVNADRMYHFLRMMKEVKNPHFRDVLDLEVYKANCKEMDPSGYELIFGDSEVDTCVENFDDAEDVIMQDVKDAIDEEVENKEKNPIKEFQFVYDETVALAPRYPELTVAPGEGHIPKSILTDIHWDVKSFPHLHNLDGSNGKDQERPVKLSAQQYFLQRICNKDTRFAKNPNYLYSSVAFLEEKKICYNVSICGTRGKKTVSKDGQVSYQLQDVYRFMEGVPNTPKYWEKCKFELLSKLDNLGPFQIFFTLSCAEKRWNPVMVDILRDLGYLVRIQTSYINGSTEITYDATDGITWKPFDIFIKEDVDVSSHELVRRNVVSVTRYFNLSFISFFYVLIILFFMF